MAGYSKRSLVDKLGVKAGWKISLLNFPKDYYKTLGKLPDGIILDGTITDTYNFIQYFVTEKQELESIFPALKKHLDKAGLLWISWPKALRPAQGKEALKTDLNENIIREIGLKNGLVDVKVCAIDDDWSGLKFVYRIKDR